MRLYISEGYFSILIPANCKQNVQCNSAFATCKERKQFPEDLNSSSTQTHTYDDDPRLGIFYVRPDELLASRSQMKHP